MFAECIDKAKEGLTYSPLFNAVTFWHQWSSTLEREYISPRFGIFTLPREDVSMYSISINLKLFRVPVVFAKQPSYGPKTKLSWFRGEHFKIVVRVWESDRKSQTVQTNFSKRIQTRCQISERLHVLKVFLWYLHYCFRNAKHFKLGTTNNFWKRLHI